MRTADSVSQMSTDNNSMNNNGQDEAFMTGDALNTLVDVYYKILKINLTKDTYNEIKVSELYGDDAKEHPQKLSEWFKNFAITYSTRSRSNLASLMLPNPRLVIIFQNH